MEADQRRGLAWIEVAEDGIADLPVEFLERLGLGTGPCELRAP
jgi:hypothetical protein